MATLDETTADRLLGGRVVIHQPARGMRISLDPVLLAGFIGAPYGRFLDIGAGTGALSFLLLARDPGATGVGAVETCSRGWRRWRRVDARTTGGPTAGS